jgi:undecaprenyl-diphosphatase
MNTRAERLLGYLAYARKERAIHVLLLLILFLTGLSIAVHIPGLTEIDYAITRSIQRMQNPFLDQLMSAFTFLGNSVTLVIIGIVAAGVFYRYSHRVAALISLLALLGLPANMLVKEWVERPRPPEDRVRVLLPRTGTSFPSGHTMGAATLFGSFGFLAVSLMPKRKRRILAVTVCAVATVGVSMSRVYVGAHWFSDVVGGWAAGLLLLLLLAQLYRRLSPAQMAEEVKRGT